MKNKIIVLLVGFIYLQAAAKPVISLAGNWRLQTDPNDAGIAEKWFTKKLVDNIELPGSMLERGKGNEVTLQTRWQPEWDCGKDGIAMFAGGMLQHGCLRFTGFPDARDAALYPLI